MPTLNGALLCPQCKLFVHPLPTSVMYFYLFDAAYPLPTFVMCMPYVCLPFTYFCNVYMYVCVHAGHMYACMFIVLVCCLRWSMLPDDNGKLSGNHYFYRAKIPRSKQEKDVHFICLYFSLQFRVKKEGFGGGGSRMLQFHQGQADFAVLKSSGKTLNISIGPGLPSSTSESCITEHYD